MKAYFDNAATSPLHPKVLEKMMPFYEEHFGNPSSTHSFGRKVRVVIEEAREKIAEFINANPGEIYFTSGGTEANNMAVFGIARTEFEESGKKKIVTSKGEHHSILDSCLELRGDGYEVYLSELNKDTAVNLPDFTNALDKSVSLASVIHINNETGAVSPVSEIIKSAKSNNVLVHIDGVQSFGKIPVDVKKLGMDSFAASAHKINGPKASGFLYAKSGTPLSPVLFGGSQERNRRGGTENVAGIIGLAEAVRIHSSEMEQDYQFVATLKKRMLDGIFNIDKENIRANGGQDSTPYILSVTLDGEFYKNDAEAMLMYLDLGGVAASNGSACTSGTWKPSHVITSAGFSSADAAGTIRLSFGPRNTEAEVDFALDVLSKMSAKFRK